VTDRYAALQRPMSVRKQRLLDSLQVQQLFRDIEDEEAWIREKEPVAASTNRGESALGGFTTYCRLSYVRLCLALLGSAFFGGNCCQGVSYVRLGTVSEG